MSQQATTEVATGQWYDQVEPGVRRIHTPPESFEWLAIDLERASGALATYVPDAETRTAIIDPFSECGRYRIGESVVFRIDLPSEEEPINRDLQFVLVLSQDRLLVVFQGERRHLETSMREVVDLLGVQSPLVSACEILDDMLDHLRGPLARINTEIEAIEEKVLSFESADRGGAHIRLRQQLLKIDRQLDALESLLQRTVVDRERRNTEAELVALGEVTNRTAWLNQRISNQLDRLRMTGDQLHILVMDDLNKSMYRLSIIATVFLPLTFITGLLGINVGGIPGEKSKWAFWIVCSILTCLAVVTMAFLVRALRKR